MTPKMKRLFESAVRKFRLAYPHMRSWTDERVLEAVMLEASRWPGSGIRVVGQYDNGELKFGISLRPPDGSDGSR